jgi:arylsulfatase
MIERPNILLITVDTLRADHLGCYGYARPTSPQIDALAGQGVLCERVFCAGIPTQPSYTSLYTGQHPLTHGIIAQGGTATLAPQAPMLPELFLKAGYTTCALDTLMRDRLWFGRGYEYYIDPGLRRPLRLAVSCEQLNRRAIPWMHSHADEPFFLFLHYWEPHAPYLPPEPYRQLFYSGNPTDPANQSLADWWRHPLGALAQQTWLRTAEGLVSDVEYVKALYDQQIRHVDDGIGALVAALDELGLAERTLVVVLADHGESLGEHGIFFEHHGLYDCTIHVPLLLRWPGRLPAGRRLPQIFQLHDVAPTILDAAGLPIPRAMEGQSLWGLLCGETQRGGREVAITPECSLQAKWCLRTDRYKLILARAPDFYGSPPRELYDLHEDPRELHNLAEAQPELADALQGQLETWIAQRLGVLGRSEDPVRAEHISLRGVLEAG